MHVATMCGHAQVLHVQNYTTFVRVVHIELTHVQAAVGDSPASRRRSRSPASVVEWLQ